MPMAVIVIGDFSPAMLLVAASRTARRTAVSGSCYTPVHRTAILSTLATAFCAAALLTGCGGSKHASPQTSTSKHTYTSVLVGDHGFRYRVTVKLRLPAIIPRLSGPPGAQYVIGDPAAFDLTIENLTRGRRAPVFPRAVAPGAGVVSAWWALPKPLRARAGALTGNKFSGRYADLAAVITREANDFDPHDPVDVDAGQTLTLGASNPTSSKAATSFRVALVRGWSRLVTSRRGARSPAVRPRTSRSRPRSAPSSTTGR